MDTTPTLTSTSTITPTPTLTSSTTTTTNTNTNTIIPPMRALWTTPDDIFSFSVADWNTPLTALEMPVNAPGSNDSSPTDFAFEPPAVSSTNNAAGSLPYKPEAIKTDSFSSNGSGISPNNGGFTPGGINSSHTYPFNVNGSFSSSYNPSSSSFSSASGSAAGGSFSSIDALPAISREFVRPSVSETRRPATAGGALQSRSPFAGFMPEDSQRFQRINQRPTSSDGKFRTVEPIQEEGMFTNPFGTPKEITAPKQVPSQTNSEHNVDPHYVPNNRRASEPQFVQPWQQAQFSHDAAATMNPPSAPAPPMGYLQQQQSQQVHGVARPNQYNGRPQTSDGLPSYPHLTGGVPLPSAQSIARQIPGMGAFYHPPTPISAREQDPKSYMPFRDDRSASLGSIQPPSAFPGDRSYSIDSGLARPGGAIRSSYISNKPGDMSQSELTFVQLGGPAPRKRPRRRYDEIERLYSCGWSGCEKSYGTLNHLNAHVAMQKHGEKRLPSEFKDMRKAWRKKKREMAASNANAQYMANAAAWTQRSSIGSSSTDSDWDRRDSAASMMSASSDYNHRSSQSYPAGYAPWSAGAESRPSTSSSSISSLDGRTGAYFPQPLAQPQQQAAYSTTLPLPNHGLGQNAYVNTINANARRVSAPQHLPMPAPVDSFRQPEGDHPTPTAQNPFPQRGGFPFTTLTSPMSAQNMMPIGQPNGSENPYGGSQFAFQR